MPKKKSSSTQSSPRILIVIVIILALAIASFAYHTIKTNQAIKSNPTQFEISTLENLAIYLNTKAEPRDYMYEDWIMPDGSRVPLKGQQIVIGTSGINGVGKYGDFSTDDLDKVTEGFINGLQEKVSEYFILNNFSKNDRNTKFTPNEYYVSTYAFEKDNIYCLSHGAKQSDPFEYISCGTIDQDQIVRQKELSSVYKEQKASYQNSPIIFRVDKINGDFASGSSSYMSGNQWIAKNIQGAWTTVWAGQDFPLCSDMAKYEVPSEFYPGCYNPATQKEQRTY